MSDNARAKLARLEGWMRDRGSVIVAYSGGVDSALLMAVAHRELGRSALACIGVSPSYPKREREAAIDLARVVGANVLLVETSEMLDRDYCSNPVDRCYHCKSALFGALKRIATEEGYSCIVDGNNADDAPDFRPGRRAAAEHGVLSPLMELGLGKEEVRSIVHLLDLPVWDKPAMACLSSRVPHGTVITAELLGRIEAAEDVLVDLGFRQFRVRHHDQVARIELLPEDLPRALELRELIVDGVRKAGYVHVALDLAGFRSSPPKRT